MKQGFVVAEIDEELGKPLSFWDGSNFAEAIEQAAFYTTKVDAKYVFGYAQAGNPEKEVAILPATLEVKVANATVK